MPLFIVPLLAALLSWHHHAPSVDWPATGAIARLPVIPSPNWKPGHRGIDVFVAPGAAVLAPASGVVVWVGSINHISGITIQDTAGRRHSLLPIESQLAVGDVVTIGEKIGVVVESDHCAFTCLHWGIRLNRRYLDPRWFAPPLIYRLSHARG